MRQATVCALRIKGLLAVFLATLSLAEVVDVFAQEGVDMGCSPTISNPCSGSNPGGGSVPIFSRPARDPAAEALQKRLSEAHEANLRGIELYNHFDYAGAVKAFQEAADKNPGDDTIRKNLAQAKYSLGQEHANRAENQRQAKISADAAKRMSDSMQGLADALTAPANAPMTSSPIDVTVVPTNPPLQETTQGAPDPCGANNGLSFGDPNTVDARCVPSGMTRALENAIADMFKDAPEGVRERVSKGFQSVVVADWPVAKAWFQDARNRDPGNVSIARFVALCDYNIGGSSPVVSGSAAPDFDQILDDFYLHYIPAHPELQFQLIAAPVNAPTEGPAKSLIDSLVERWKQFGAKPKGKLTIVSAVRG